MREEAKIELGILRRKTPLSPEQPPASLEPALPLDKVEEAIRSIRHGVVQVIIQDGHIVQIDKTEKIRLK